MAYCRKCGKQLAEGMDFCISCGTPVKDPGAPVRHEQASEPAPGIETPKRRRLPVGALIGIIAGGTVLLMIVAFFVFLLFQSFDGNTPVSMGSQIAQVFGGKKDPQSGNGQEGPGNIVSGTKETKETTETTAETKSETTTIPETETTAPAITSETTQASTSAPETAASPETAAISTEETSDIPQWNNTYDAILSGKDVQVYISGFHEVYTSSDLDVRGTVTYGPSSNSCVESENVYLLGVEQGKNGTSAYIAYSSQVSGTARGYIPMSVFSKDNGSLDLNFSSGEFYVIWDKDDSFTGDHRVGTGDPVYMISDEGDGIYCIMYPIDSGGWRIGYCRSSDYNSYVAP